MNEKKPIMKIEPCPFCRSSDVHLLIDRHHKPINHDFYVKCNKCLAQGFKVDIEGFAIISWNEVSELANMGREFNKNEALKKYADNKENNNE